MFDLIILSSELVVDLNVGRDLLIFILNFGIQAMDHYSVFIVLVTKCFIL